MQRQFWLMFHNHCTVDRERKELGELGVILQGTGSFSKVAMDLAVISGSQDLMHKELIDIQ